QQSVPLAAGQQGKPSSATVDLDVKRLQARNRLMIEFIGHVRPVCDNPEDPAVWVNVAATSTLTVAKSQLTLPNDLSRFPVPFLDPASDRPLVLPVVLSKDPSDAERTAAAVIAGFFGSLAEWRGASFPALAGELPPEQHCVVFATNERRPEFLRHLPRFEEPQVIMASAPMSLTAKMLVVAGADEAQMLAAAQALTVRDRAMIGERVRFKGFSAPAPLAPYAAPKWLDTGSEAELSRFMQFPRQLTAAGPVPWPVGVTVRLAPDLFMMQDATVDLKLKYRYSKPAAGETAQLRTLVNGLLVDSVNLDPAASRGERTFRLPTYDGPLAVDPGKDAAPALVNQISFAVGYQAAHSAGSLDNCRSISLPQRQVDIDPSSRIVLSGLQHYAQLPDLGLFMRSGFPFTKHADLAQTVALVPKGADTDVMTTLLNAVGRMGAATGAAPVHLTVRSAWSDADLMNKDVLVAGRVLTAMTDINEAQARALAERVKGV
ncbi:MAG: cellulose biosynthesis cyclic di-GMP-binding regulatory protein BcsB, partial [Duodenibacillus sp.]|nr:cellulose biosynthesis cyclic di-GMP-binding regulatory protein BcsB [Duodenibacillus sp.]